MKKICFVTAARSEYGLLKWLMKEVETSTEFELQIIVTGGHLLEEQGHTIDQIKNDGFKIDEEVDAKLDLSSKETIAASMGRMAERMSAAFARLSPDYVAVLGDRYELLSICGTAFIMQIPIIHLSGGDITEGAIDDGIRNSVTMLATYHFPGTAESAENIARMRGSHKNIWAVGEPGLDAFNKEFLLNRTELSEDIGIDEKKEWVLLTYHPETKRSLCYNLSVVKDIVEILLSRFDVCVVATYSNTDYGGAEINAYLEKCAEIFKDKLKVIPSLGTNRYLSLMKQVKFVIGNSSSGIIEAPSLRKAVINIGDRQQGRYLCNNVIQCAPMREDINQAIERAMECEVDDSDANYWGDGHTGEKIIEILKENVI